MAVMSADKNVETVGAIVTMTFAAVADTYYQGAIVHALEAGNATCAPVATSSPIGVCLKQQVVATTGDPLEVMVSGIVALPTGLAITDENGLIGYDADTSITDNIADAVMLKGLTLANDDCIIGMLIRVWNSKGYIKLGSMTGARFLAAQDAWV